MKNIKYVAVSFLFSGILFSQKIDLNKMPKPGPTPVINIESPKTFQLENGLTVLVVENHKLPHVDMYLSIDRPPIYEGEKAGVMSVLSDQLDKGTKNISKDDYSKKIDFLGADISFSSSGASASTLSRYFTQVLGLLSDAIVNPLFKEEEINKSKSRAIEGLKISEKNAQQIAGRVGSALIYGKNTALGEMKTQATINNIHLEDVNNFYQKYYTPDHAYLVIVGDVKLDEVKSLVAQSFVNWKKTGAKFEPFVKAKNISATEIDIVDVPSAVQSVISITNLVDLEKRDPWYISSLIAKNILGGGAEARLFMNLREKHAFTYGAYSSLDVNRYASSFTSSASVRNEVTAPAVKEFLNELRGISTIKQDELTRTKASMKGKFILSLENPETIALFYLNQKLENLPDNFYRNYLKNIDAVQVKDVENAAKKIVLPNQSRIIVTGKASEIYKELEAIGYPVKYFDKEANETQKPVEKKVDGITPITVADRYIQEIGGKEKLEKIQSISQVYEASAKGVKLGLKNEKTKDGKLYYEMLLMGNPMIKTVFDGKQGYVEFQGQKKFLTDKELADVKDVHVFNELYFNDQDFKVKGIEQIDGQEVYVVAKGDKETYYYNVKTGLLQRQIDKSSDITFSEYKPYEGIKIPTKLVLALNGQEVTFTLTSCEFNKVKDSDFK